MQSWRQSSQVRRAVQDELSMLQRSRLDRPKTASAIFEKTSPGSSEDASTETEESVPERLSQPSSNSQSNNLTQSEKQKSCGDDSETDIARRLKGVSIEVHGGKTVFVVRVAAEDHNDICDAHNWSSGFKWTATAIVGSAGALVGWASSIDSGALDQGVAEFGVSEVAQSLSTGLFLIAFGFGAFFAAPLSETAGRNPTYILTLALFCCFTLGSALAPNFGGLLVMRFISGFFAATPLVTFGGSTSDMWNATERTYVFPVCACLSFLGPFLAPMVGSFIGASPLISWRWVYWITLIFGGLVLGSILFCMPETYTMQLLSWKAKHLRKLTGDVRYMSEHEIAGESFLSRIGANLARPFDLFLHEPMVVLFSLYLVVVYIILFGFLTGYPFIFGEVYKFSEESIGLCYIGINIGFMVAFVMILPIYQKYKKDLAAMEAAGSDELPPETRLIFTLVGAPWLPISLFWMAWTSYPGISYWSPLVATVPLGFATMAIFIPTYLYIIDSYTVYAASALVGATLLRYIAAGVMVPVTIPMYKNLGHHWALTLLALIAMLATPIPYIFYRYGAKIRARSKSAQQV